MDQEHWQLPSHRDAWFICSLGKTSIGLRIEQKNYFLGNTCRYFSVSITLYWYIIMICADRRELFFSHYIQNLKVQRRSTNIFIFIELGRTNFRSPCSCSCSCFFWFTTAKNLSWLRYCLRRHVDIMNMWSWRNITYKYMVHNIVCLCTITDT